MANISDHRSAAIRIREATMSLTDARDIEVVRDYLTELEILAALQEAEDFRPRIEALRKLAS